MREMPEREGVVGTSGMREEGTVPSLGSRKL